MVDKRKKMILFGVCAAVVTGALGMHLYGKYQSVKAAAENPGRIETVQVTKQNLIDSISVTGTIASADAWDVQASAKNVEVLEVNYKVGDYVHAGDVIVVLDSSDLELSLVQARNNQTLSEYKENKSIETASGNYAEAVEDGTDEYAKAVKVESEAKEALQEAEGDASEAARKLKSQEERLSELKNSGTATAEEISAAQAEYTSRHQAYTAAEEAEKKAQEVYEEAAENLADAQKKNDRNISSAADSLEQAQMEHTYSNDSSQKTIENYQEQIESCTVTSPISGVITAVNVDVGDTYQGEGNTLFSVADNEHFIVSANVDEYDIGSIQKEMTAAVIVEALGDEELPAKVSFVSPTAVTSNTGSSSYALEIALDDANTNLRIGMTAKASIVLDAVYDVLTVPYDCVTTDEEGNSVMTIEEDGGPREISVTVGMQGDYYVEVSGEGLDENTKVYYATPMADSAPAQDPEGGIMEMPASGGRQGRPDGGPGGGPGGF